MLPSRGVLGSRLRRGSNQNACRLPARLSRPSVTIGVRSMRTFGTTKSSRTTAAVPSSANPGFSIRSTSLRPIASLSRHAQPWHPSVRPSQRRFASSAPASAPPPTPTSSEPVFTQPTIEPNSLLDDLSATSLLNLPEQIGYLQALGLDYGWGPTSLMQWTLEHIHIYTGLPWFASIALTALAVRLALFKPALTAAEQSAKLTELRKNPRFLEVQKTMMEALRDPDRRMEGMMLRREFGAMRQKAGVKIWKTLVPLLQLPIGLGMFRLLRGMATLPVPGMENGGFLWFTDLTIPDPLFVLPIASAGIMWWIMKQQLPFTPPESRAMMKTLAYVITPVSLIVTIYLPAGVQWFFLVSAILQYGQSWLWRQPWLRKWAKLGPIPFSPTQSGRVVQGANGGMKWQAAAQPRSGGGGAGTVIPTTARSLSEAEGDLSVRGIAQGLKDGWGSVKEKRDAYVQKTTAKTEKSRQKDYEEKRALEDDDGFYERRNRRRRQ